MSNFYVEKVVSVSQNVGAVSLFSVIFVWLLIAIRKNRLKI